MIYVTLAWLRDNLFGYIEKKFFVQLNKKDFVLLNILVVGVVLLIGAQVLGMSEPEKKGKDSVVAPRSKEKRPRFLEPLPPRDIFFDEDEKSFKEYVKDTRRKGHP